MTHWLVTGAGGQLGVDLVRTLAEQGQQVTGCDRRALDITSADAVDDVLGTAAPTHVVNCAAYTAVDAAERDEAAAAAVNADGPRHLAAWCVAHGVTLVQVSTDYVFAGDARVPYTEESPVGPRSAYGRSKLEGERAVLAAGGRSYVVRTSWVYGAHGSNFVATIARLAGERDVLDVVDDQHGSPTWTGDLAAALVELGQADPGPGVWHCTGAGETTWFGLARQVFAELGLDPERVRPTTTAAFPRPAPRPAYSVLSNAKWSAAGLRPMPDWQTALRQALPAMGLAASPSS